MNRDTDHVTEKAERDKEGYRAIPSVDRLLADPELPHASTMLPAFAARVVREELLGVRARIAQGEALTEREIREHVRAALERREKPRLRAVINGTGVVIHTNLGRASVSAAAGQAMVEAATHAVALEIDLDSGKRGGRMAEISALMTVLTEADQSIVVNNNAAAVLLVLSALTAGREVVVSRGEAVEIGGGFRVPDVLAQSGAILVEVGTTNRTYARDYADAVTDRTGCFLKVHPSNFQMRGFTHAASISELADIGQQHGIPVIEDLGSGALIDTQTFGLQAEPTIGERLRAGAAVVTASGDKLLGGPQAGIIVGSTELVERIAKHPLARAVRADKTCLAGVAATLRHYVRGEATEQIPVWRMIAASVSTLDMRTLRLVDRLRERGVDAERVDTVATIGGGSLPGQTLPSRGIAIRPVAEMRLDDAARQLRIGHHPVVPRVGDDRIVIDLRTVLAEDDDTLLDAVVRALGQTGVSIPVE